MVATPAERPAQPTRGRQFLHAWTSAAHGPRPEIEAHIGDFSFRMKLRKAPRLGCEGMKCPQGVRGMVQPETAFWLLSTTAQAAAALAGLGIVAWVFALTEDP